MEMIADMVYKLINGVSPKDYEETGWAGNMLIIFIYIVLDYNIYVILYNIAIEKGD